MSCSSIPTLYRLVHLQHLRPLVRAPSEAFLFFFFVVLCWSGARSAASARIISRRRKEGGGSRCYIKRIKKLPGEEEVYIETSSP